jgi:putative transposase
MIRLQAFKYELMPNGGPTRDLRRFTGSRRFVFNQARALQKTTYEAGGKKLGVAGLCQQLTARRNGSETPWLKDAPVHPLQQSHKDLERAHGNFFAKRALFPRFKREGPSESLRDPHAKQFEIDAANGHLKLPKLDWVRDRNSRDIPVTAKNITVSPCGGKWYASIQTEREAERPVPAATTAIGIDMGIARFATLSDGTFVAPLNRFKRHEARLRRHQRSVSRKTKFSNHWKKARTKVRNLPTRIGNARRDFLHKTTTTLRKSHAMVCVEDVQVRNLSRSSKGNTEAPGKNVRAQSGLNKAVLDQGWFEFRRPLECPLNGNGGRLIKVPPHPTSRTCPACAHVAARNRHRQARFAGVACGNENNADVVGAINAATNVLAPGHRVAACAQDGSGRGRTTTTKPASTKHEPTEATVREGTHA